MSKIATPKMIYEFSLFFPPLIYQFRIYFIYHIHFIYCMYFLTIDLLNPQKIEKEKEK